MCYLQRVFGDGDGISRGLWPPCFQEKFAFVASLARYNLFSLTEIYSVPIVLVNSQPVTTEINVIF